MILRELILVHKNLEVYVWHVVATDSKRDSHHSNLTVHAISLRVVVVVYLE